MSILMLVPFMVPMDGGLLDLISNKNHDVLSTLRDVCLTIAVFFILLKVIETKFAIARLLMAGLGAALFLWTIGNIDTIKGWLGQEVNAGPQPTVVIQPPGDHLAMTTKAAEPTYTYKVIRW